MERTRNLYLEKKTWEAVKRVIRYFKITINYKLVVSSSQHPFLRVYDDAIWANVLVERKSTTGNLHMLGKILT